MYKETKGKRLNPMSDFVFKALFGKEDNTSKKLLISFLNDVLAKNEEPIVSITYLNPFNLKEFESDKLSILDIKAKTDKGEIINVEIQVKAEDNYRKRSLYYWSESYSKTIKESEFYLSLKKTIVINIMGENIIKESCKYHTVFKIKEDKENFVLTDDLQIHFIELDKFPKKDIEELSNIELWLDFLKEAGKIGNEERLQKLMERSETMRDVINELEEISADEKMREAYLAREKSRLDYNSKLKYAEIKGIEQGKIEVAQKLLEEEVSIDLIEKATGLSKETILKLLQA